MYSVSSLYDAAASVVPQQSIVNPLDRVRLQKAAADCGFEMTATGRDDGLELRSAHFPETVQVRNLEAADFELLPSDPLLLDEPSEGGAARVQGYGALYALLKSAAARSRTMPNRVADAFFKEAADRPRSTEAGRLVVQRLGQQPFRAALLDYWQGRFCMTGLDVPELLRASHIKPWAACGSDNERLDVFNGLLLVPHLDALLASGLLTIDDDASVRISMTRVPKARASLGLEQPLRVAGLKAGHRRYLKHHCNVVRHP